MGVITQRGSILNSFALAAKASQPQQDVIQQHQEAKRTEHEIVMRSFGYVELQTYKNHIATAQVSVVGVVNVH